MSRTLLLLTLALVPLSGCLSADATPAALEAPADEATMHEPVLINEHIDLALGEPGRDWAFTIHPGATKAVVTFEVVGPGGTDLAQETSWCFRLQGPAHTARDCGLPAANVQVGIGVGGAETFYHWSPAPAGTYTVHFDSAPSVGTFHAYVNVQYE